MSHEHAWADGLVSIVTKSEIVATNIHKNFRRACNTRQPSGLDQIPGNRPCSNSENFDRQKLEDLEQENAILHKSAMILLLQVLTTIQCYFSILYCSMCGGRSFSYISSSSRRSRPSDSFRLDKARTHLPQSTRLCNFAVSRKAAPKR